MEYTFSFVQLRKLAVLFIVLACAFFTFADSASAAAYIKFDGVDGESKDSEHKGWIDVLSIDWGIAKPTNQNGQTRRRAAARVDNVSFTKQMDRASADLQLRLLSGEVTPNATVELTRWCGERQVTYLKYELKNVLISSYNVSGDADDRPTEEVAFYFNKIAFQYTQHDSSCQPVATAEYSWDLKEGK